MEMRRWYDDVERYTHFGHDAEIFESEEPYKEVGEGFSTWCQRRIEEMRCVKEGRLRSRKPQVVKQRALKSMVYRDRTRPYDVYIGDETSTTLPTNAYDALGHELLRSISMPGRWLRKRATLTFAAYSSFVSPPDIACDIYIPCNNFVCFRGSFAADSCRARRTVGRGRARIPRDVRRVRDGFLRRWSRGSAGSSRGSGRGRRRRCMSMRARRRRRLANRSILRGSKRLRRG